MTKIRNRIEIMKKTNELIKEINSFKKIERNFNQTSAKLVSELIDLHRIDNPDYSFSNLLQEKELQDYSDIIEKYVPYNINPTVTKFYNEGKLDNCDMMVLANTDKEFQQPEKMNKIVTKIITKEINSKDLIRASKNEIREMIGEEIDEMSDYHAMVLQSVYHINHASKFINENTKQILSILSKDDKKKIIENFNHLKNAIQFGLKIKL